MRSRAFGSIGWLAALSLILLSSPAHSLQAGTRCILTGLLGIADGIPGDLLDRFNALPSPLINDIPTDDALTCVRGHTLDATVDTQTEWAIELANTTSHEVGHLISLLHLDDIGDDDLMDGPYDGADKGFGPTSFTLLNTFASNTTQVVWIDFEAESLELPAHYQGFGLSKQTQFPLDAPMLATLKANILSQVIADYNGGANYNNGFNVVFTATKPVSGSFSTISFFVPEPSTMLLLGMGMLACTGLARRARSN